MKVQKPSWFSRDEIRGLIQRRPWSILSWGSGIIALAFMAFYGISALGNPTANVGQQFVASEYLFAKPITWFSYSTFLYWTFGLEAQKSHFLNYSDRTRRFLFIVTALIGFGALYEIFFNFMLWGALEVRACSLQNCNQLDVLAYAFQNVPVNLVFDTKIVILVFGLSMYSLYFLHRVERERERRNPVPAFPRQESYGVDRVENVPITRSYPFQSNASEQKKTEPLHSA